MHEGGWIPLRSARNGAVVVGGCMNVIAINTAMTARITFARVTSSILVDRELALN